jgi:HAD superfamily hydrolase (TIGR01490 family)
MAEREGGLALFDLDGTLLPIDSDHAWGDFMVALGWVDAASFRRGNDDFYASYRAGTLDIDAYIAFATAPLRTQSAAARVAAQARFMREVIAPALRPAALELVESHRRRGDRLAIVTSTSDFITRPIAAAFGIDAESLIATRLVAGADGAPTGAIDGVPAFRDGKVVRVGQWLAASGADWSDFARISVYGDTVNDLALLETATDPVAVNPSPELEAVARARGWRILHLFA